VMAFFALLWYPVKRLLKKRKLAEQPVTGDKLEDPEDAGTQ